MRPIRFKKLMQGIKVIKNKEPVPFEVTLSPGTVCDCELECWREEQMRKLEQSPSYITLLQQFAQSFELPDEILGKKSSEITISKSYALCLKSINQEDLSTLNHIFSIYSQFRASQKQNILISLLAVVVLHTFHLNSNKWSDPFLIMPNIKPKSGVFFDIKGHTDNRFISPSDFKDFGFGKDENFMRSQYRQLLRKASEDFKKHFFQTLKKNLTFLRKCRVIDYSLALIFVERDGEINSNGIKWEILNEKYQISFCIIDYLQLYNQRKRLENKVKSLFFKEVSSVDLQTYAHRLLEFLKKALS